MEREIHKLYIFLSLTEERISIYFIFYNVLRTLDNVKLTL